VWAILEGKWNIPFQFFGDIPTRLLPDLLHDANVRFGVLAERVGLTKKGGADIVGGVYELLSEFIQGWDATSQIVETTPDSALGATMLVQEVDEPLLGPGAGEGDGVLVFFSLSKKLDSGEGFDAVHHGDRLIMARVRVHVCKDTILLTLEVS
jgi:hypothetical protein